MHIEIQGGLVKLKGESFYPQNEHPSARGKITSFSKKSRKRLLEMIARIKEEGQALFVTLTYGQEWPSDEQAKKHLKAFIRRVERVYPKAGIVWRLEYQKRGAPHFHLIIFNVPFIAHEKVSAKWAEIIGNEYCDNSSGTPKPPFCRTEGIKNNRKKVMLYVSKYIAKEDNGNWFNIVPYQNRAPGRFWGIAGRENIVFAVKVTMTITRTATMDALCRLAKKIYPKLKFFRHGQGFTLFTENSSILTLAMLLEEYHTNGRIIS